MKRKPYELYLDRVWKWNKLRFDIISLVQLPIKIGLAVKYASGKTYYPEFQRKKYLSRVADNVLWACKHLEPNVYYNSYGLDVKGLHHPDDYLPYREFKLSREGALYSFPEKYRFSYQILVRDKYIFSTYLSKALGENSVPQTYAVVDDGRVISEPSKETTSIDALLETHPQVICKIIDGECADSVLLLKKTDEGISNGSQPITAETLKGIFQGKRYLVQEVIKQHQDIDKLNPYCVNTIRIITVRGKSGSINVLAASIRIGARKDSFVDNRAAGGMAVGIRNDGTLMKYGFQHAEFGGRNEKHPVTGVVFDGYQLPHWPEVIDLVTRAHRCIIGLQSIGWDVAITPNGPVLIEGNDNWEIANPQDAIGGLKKRWYELINC